MHPRLLIIFASRHGQTAKIAHRIADVAAENGFETTAVDVGVAAPGIRVDSFDAVIIAGAVKFGKHSAKLRAFVQQKLADLKKRPSAFVSVSGAARSAEGIPMARAYAEAFLESTGWKPSAIATCAGALPFTKYGFVTRWIVASSEKKQGRRFDTHRDYEFTDWDGVDRFARDFVQLSAGASSSTTGQTPSRQASPISKPAAAR